MYLIYDTESTGFPSKALSDNHPSQARIVQFAAILYDSDWNIKKELCALIYPTDNWKIHEGAQAVHGITVEQCKEKGVKIEDVLGQFYEILKDAKHVVAHNLQFDETMLYIETCRQPMIFQNSFGLVYASVQKYCTMELTTDILKLPQKRKNSFGSKWKWPKLIEAYQYFYPQQSFQEHSALTDAKACADIFKQLVFKELVKI